MIAARAIDRLPGRLWSVGNIYLVFGRRVHLCLADGKRTVEVDGRELARGTRPIAIAHPEENARLAEALWAVDLGWLTLAALGCVVLVTALAGRAGSTRSGPPGTA